LSPQSFGVPVYLPSFRALPPALVWVSFVGVAVAMEEPTMTLFEKIIARQIPAQIVYEDDQVLAFKDIKPAAPTHILVIPKKVIPRIAEAKPDDHKVLGHLLLKAAEIAEKSGLTKSGYRLVINNGPDAGESVPHLHCHIIGGRSMSWPPG
jgi:histidine triad (HIT) family protein